MTMTPRDLFAALSQDTRLRCLMLLATQGELCVCELTQATGVVQPHVSRHLAQLRELNLVQDRREGLWVHYRLHPDLPGWIRTILRETVAVAHIQSPFIEDVRALASMSNRPMRVAVPAPLCAVPTVSNPSSDLANQRERLMSERLYNVLFLCTGNSARSILAERILERWGSGHFRGFSAGSHPKGAVHPLALEILKRNNYLTEGLRSKDWAEFAQPDAPVMDFVFTVCDQAAGEVCPVWPGQPMTAHWGMPDPAAVEGDEVARMMAFRTAFRELENRLKIFVALPLVSLDRLKLQRELNRIGTAHAPAPSTDSQD
jgi:protein-tyrosine-phosphatase/DNA-binding transcriptional ArsR family regulator